MNNIKLYGININGFTVIPCYYDVIRFYKKSVTIVCRKLNIIDFQNVWYHWSKLFNSNLK
jgi:hypothetical protein